MNRIMEIRKQVRLSQWSEMVREREESGLSIREFCTGKAISPKTYYYRLRKLREAAIEASTPEIVQVDIPEPFNPVGIVIRPNATTIEITGSANPGVYPKFCVNSKSRCKIEQKLLFWGVSPLSTL